ncbi:non-specific lipid transfer protein GPI-anchored 1-like [Salvia hispanica]|uniref:non-specific lipid transfer protein GPI-anchored 1-like n=1 Tax=Salvia hispanica TaxID=49212 RepID=UPI0020092668|nr:non-specific lipid transfer protein GPI-anchored 1-like [Salvia hispanica]
MAMKRSAKLAAAILCLAVVAGGGAETIAEKCAAEFQKVTQCLSFVTAKAKAPSKDCCNSVTELKDTDPACLCYIIEQVHNGSNPAIKSMGVQESLLLQLPSACKLANASITECPKLLNLPPNSPDAAIFTNTSTSATSTPVATPGTSSPTPNKGDWQKPQVAGCVTVATAMFILWVTPF